MTEEIKKLQNQIVSKINKHCKENNIKIDDLTDKSGLNKKRTQEILENSGKIATLAELYSLSKAINLEFSEIFKIDKD